MGDVEKEVEAENSKSYNRIDCEERGSDRKKHTVMTSAPTLQPKFLPARNQLGLVSVGFSGGQVRTTFSHAQDLQ